MNNPIALALQFEQAINSRDPEAICSLMASDGEFIDSLGNRIQGTEKLRSAWTGYFKMVPDYSISHSEVFADGSTVAIFGSAQGTSRSRPSYGEPPRQLPPDCLANETMF